MGSDLRARARRAYERGRLRMGLLRGAVAVPILVIGLAGCRTNPTFTVLGGAALWAVVALFVWRGQTLGQAVTPGLLAGAPALVIPLLLRPLMGHTCAGGACVSHCLTACVAGGLVAGALVGVYSARAVARRTEFLLAAGLVASLAGSLGCVLGGAPGVLGMIAGLALTSAPIAILAHARR